MTYYSSAAKHEIPEHQHKDISTGTWSQHNLNINILTLT
jgi:hypothetical protein